MRGSHNVFKHPSRPGIVVVPHPKKDLGTGLVAAIRKQAGL
ncbi:type II toxin-antitoxin system HicA family toxin [Komagataeibacter intermedius]|nr:type II toxin-antitoxin system HicA family toxin [Komagataeibacter intermedius]MCF3636532.1 type II toxin-antitoxin system HicA family toxin [Komagataeibacter intermedius]